jgi:hypothetical protein
MVTIFISGHFAIFAGWLSALPAPKSKYTSPVYHTYIKSIDEYA